MNEPQLQIYEFDNFRVDAAQRLLTKDGALKELLKLSATEHVPPYNTASIYNANDFLNGRIEMEQSAREIAFY